jgi:uncharacterized spore protein YtfJ
MSNETQETKVSVEAIENLMTRLIDAGKVASVFGQPIERGDTTVIPCSELAVGMGMGMGSGSGPTDEGVQSVGGGGGGGGGAHARPVACIVISPSGVRMEPIVDATKVALALFTALGFIFFWLARLGKATSGCCGCCEDDEPSPQALAKAIA